MSSPTENQSGSQKRKALYIAIAFLLAILANLILSLSQGLQTGAWQHFARVGLVLAFGVIAVIATIKIRHGEVERGLWLILGGFLGTLSATSLLLGGISVILMLIELVLGGTLTFLGLPKVKRNRALAIIVLVAVFTFLIDLLPLNYRIPSPSAFTNTLPVIAVVVSLAIIVLTLYLSRETIRNYLRSSVRNRLTTIVIGAAIVPVLLASFFLGGITFFQIRNALLQTTFDRLSAIEANKIAELETYFNKSQNDMEALRETMEALRDNAINRITAVNNLKRSNMARAFDVWSADVRDVASDPGVVVGMKDLATGFQVLGSDQARELYLNKEDLETAGDESLYSAAHFEQHGFFTGYAQIHSYENAFLIDPAGNIVYNIHKGDSFGTNLVNGPYQDSNLAMLYNNLLNAPLGSTYVADAGTFEEKTAMFIGTPIYNNGAFAGILAYQIPLSQINDIMAETSGFGKTSETFLVALEEDGRITLRNDRIPVNENFVIGFDITDRAPQFVKAAANGQSGNILAVGGQGESVVAAYQPLNIEGLNWALIGKIGAEEALVPTHPDAQDDFLKRYSENYGYYDVFLIGKDGFVFYTAAKQADYKTYLTTGEFRDTNLATLVGEILEEGEPLFTDLALYEPSANKPAAFFGTPVFENPDGTGELQMIVAAQISVDNINRIMNEPHGLGESGESYIIGQDFLGRMDSRFIDQFGVETTVLNQDYAVDTEAVRSAIAGEAGQGTILDYRGIPVLSVWTPFVVHHPDPYHPEGQVWAILTEIDESEALQPVNQLASVLGLIIGFAVLGIGALAVFLGARFAVQFIAPLLELTDTAVEVAEGNLNLTIETDSEDEIGTLTTSFNNMTLQLRDLIGSLEQRIADRTHALETSTEVSRRLSTILDRDQLVKEVVEQLVSEFDYYYAHIYLFDEKKEKLVMMGGTGEAGKIMLSRGHTVDKGRGLVGRAAETNTVVLVEDTLNEEGWLPNELLPETRAEVAVPISIGENVIGVFDVQDDEIGGITEDDAGLLQALANQVAIALQNAEAYAQAQRRAQREALITDISQQIQNANSIEDAMQIATRELGRALNTNTQVRLNLKDKDKLN